MLAHQQLHFWFYPGTQSSHKMNMIIRCTPTPSFSPHTHSQTAMTIFPPPVFAATLSQHLMYSVYYEHICSCCDIFYLSILCNSCVALSINPVLAIVMHSVTIQISYVTFYKTERLQENLYIKIGSKDDIIRRTLNFLAIAIPWHNPAEFQLCCTVISLQCCVAASAYLY